MAGHLYECLFDAVVIIIALKILYVKIFYFDFLGVLQFVSFEQLEE